MYCVKSRVDIEDTIKKSRFIGVIVPCAGEREVLAQLQNLRQEHPHASHIAFAYRLKTGQGLVYRFHDAGEPAGTAGKPIFQHLEGKELINALMAVIRYYGGIKLGAGGLTRAYGNAAKRAIEAAELSAYVELAQADLLLDYSRLQELEYALKQWQGRIIGQEFAGQVRLRIELPARQLPDLIRLFSAEQLRG